MMNKSQARQFVWSQLYDVARPDSRFHYDFNEYIPDFVGSDRATDRLRKMALYQEAGMVFVTPDNCLEKLREYVLQDGKTQVVPTYGIRRGFVELVPDEVPETVARYVVLLDVMEKVGRSISLTALKERQIQFDWLVTGASAVNKEGIRFGKGHGFFDLEWAMLYEVGAVDEATPVIAFVHDCQVVDVDLELTPFDTVCDYIVTPSRTIEVGNPQKPTQGVIWDKLEPDMMANITLLKEAQELEKRS